jgi:hypothetical protein
MQQQQVQQQQVEQQAAPVVWLTLQHINSLHQLLSSTHTAEYPCWRIYWLYAS